MTPVDARTVPAGSVLQADLCVIGSGPAGVTLAREAAAGMDVVLLESGGMEESEADDLNAIRSIGAPRVLDQRLVRVRRLGGSSATWWGRAAVFDETDFGLRPWVPGSGWPIDRAVLVPYFARAARHLGLGVDDNLLAPDLARPGQPAFDDSRLRPYRWTYSRDPADAEEAMRFGPAALRLTGVRILTRATVTHLDTDPTARTVTAVEVRSPDGTVRHVRARRVVLAAGGIENARLLLASNRVAPAGLGNEHDVVGRFLMDHLRGPVAGFAPAGFRAVQRALGAYRASTDRGRVRVVPGAALAPEVQRAESLLQAALWVEGELAGDDPVLAARALLRDRRPRHLVDLARAAPLAAESVVRTRVLGRSSLRRRSSMQVHCIVEQAPNRDSRVLLGEERDALGTPVCVVDWRVGAQEARTVRRATALFAAELARLGLPVPTLDQRVIDPSLPLGLLDVAHPTGTTRMALRPQDGVVDTDSRVHGVDNLYVAGSSVFPTSGHANPTQTILALAIRLGDHLRGLP